MNDSGNFTMLGFKPIYFLMNDKPAAKVLYEILSSRACEEVAGMQVFERSSLDFSYYSFEMLVRLRNGSYHSIAIRMLEKLEDLDKFFEPIRGNLFEIEDDQGDLCVYIPRTRLLVYFFLSGELPGGKAVCRAGFPTGADDIENYEAKMPTMIISTEGEGDGSELSRLAHYLRYPDPENPQFGIIGELTEFLRKHCP